MTGDARVFDALNLNETALLKQSKNWEFLSPELLDNDLITSTSSQVWWDLGIILYQLATCGLHPFWHPNPKVISKLIHFYPCTFAINLSSAVNPKLQQLIADLLAKDPEERLGSSDSGGVNDLLNSAFMQS